jgi:Mrp family chromosome partitioning ATPase
MSTLDAAFIKAYRKGTLAPPQAVDAPNWSLPERRTLETTMYGSAHATPPAPHVSFRPGFFGGAPEASPPEKHNTTAVAESLYPAYEVRRFVWPVLVRELIESIGGELTSLVNLLAARCREGNRSLMVSGCRRGEGRTTLVMALAQMAAANGLTTAIVDADFRHPELAELMGVEPQIGAEEVLSGGQPLADALIESVEEHITLLPLLSPVDVVGLLAGSHRLADLVRTLHQHYHLVLIDSGPLEDDRAAVDLAAALTGSPVDDALVVRDVGSNTSEQVKAVGRRLAAVGIKRWDVADNFVGPAR